jgi:hypothetical protein
MNAIPVSAVQAQPLRRQLPKRKAERVIVIHDWSMLSSLSLDIYQVDNLPLVYAQEVKSDGDT